MNLKNLILIAFAFVMTSSVYAQGNILNAKTPDEMFTITDEQKANDNDDAASIWICRKKRCSLV